MEKESNISLGQTLYVRDEGTKLLKRSVRLDIKPACD